MKKTFPLQEIKSLLEQEYTITKIAEIYETSRVTMSKFLKENNLTTKHQDRINKLDNNKIIELYNDGKTINEIANLFEVSTMAIKTRLKENNVHIRTNSESHRKYNLNEHYFDNLDNLTKIYLVGFIAADGCITDRNELVIGVAKKDSNLVKSIQEELESTRPLIEDEKSIELRISSI